MPNTGKPSKDCHTCRKRRVKCTLERPECDRCLRIGSRCPGYRDEQDLMFRNEDISSLGGLSAKRDRRRARSHTSSDGEGSSTPPQLPVPCDWTFRGIKLRDLDPIVLNTASPSMSPIPLHRWHHYALPLVLALFSYETDGQRMFAYSQVLADLLLKCAEQSPLALCAEALGIAYLANRFPSAEAEATRDQAYVRALAAARILVVDRELCQQHEAPTSVYLLNLYEVVVGSLHVMDGSSTVTWGIHAQGLTELLRLRGPEQLDTPAGRTIFTILAKNTQTRTLITGEDFPEFIKDWSRLLGPRDRPSLPSRDFFHLSSEFAYEMANIATQAREAMTTDNPHFLSWNITDVWSRLLAFRPTLDQALYDYPIGEPASADNIYFSNHYRTLYMRALQHVLGFVDSKHTAHCSVLPSEQIASIAMTIRNIIQSLADEILSTASMILAPWLAKRGRRGSKRPSLHTDRPVNWTDILKLLWPMRILGCRKHLLTHDQAEFTERALQCMSEDFCMRQSVATYHPIDVEIDT